MEPTDDKLFANPPYNFKEAYIGDGVYITLTPDPTTIMLYTDRCDDFNGHSYAVMERHFISLGADEIHDIINYATKHGVIK